MSKHFEKNIRFVQDWANTMKTLCPEEEAEDFDWVIETLYIGVRSRVTRAPEGKNSASPQAPKISEPSAERVTRC